MSAREISVRRYVEDYNAYLFDLAKQWPERVLPVRTEELNQIQVQQGILRFAGFEGGTLDTKLNATGTTGDGNADRFRY
jgi:hypothetical protein